MRVGAARATRRVPVALALALVGALVVPSAPAAAQVCGSDQSSYLDTFADATCLADMSGTDIDVDGGLRLATGGTATPTVWDTPADFDNPPSGDTGDLQVVGSGPSATLELVGSALPLSPAAPASSPTGAEFVAGPTQVRDSDGVEDPSVVRVGATYLMYYTGHAEDGSPPAIYRVASDDGRAFERPPISGSDPNPAPVLSAGAPGSWDAAGVFGADVVYDPGDLEAPYRMYYSGRSAHRRAIGYATSTDGISWVKEPQPVLEPGIPGSRDSFAVANPSVLKDGDGYEMWFEGDDSTVRSIGHATSVDGVDWSRSGLPAGLQQDPLGGGDPNIRFGIFSPTVWPVDGGYRMVFVGRSSTDPTSTRLLGATSPDGSDWTISGPELNPAATRFYATNLSAPSVLVDPDDPAAPYKLYFAGDRAQSTPSDDRARIGLAQATSAAGAFSAYTGGSDPLEAIYNPGADSTRFDARAATGFSVGDPGGTNPWVGAYAGTRSRETPTRPRLGIATFDPGTSTWTKRDGSESDKAILALGGASEDANGQRDPALFYRQGIGAGHDWWLYYTALPSDGAASSIRLASAPEDTAPNGLRPTTWTKAVGLAIAGASHPAVLRTGSGAPIRIYHTVEDGTPTSLAVVTSTTNDDEDSFGAPIPVLFSGPATCDPDGAKDPVVTQIGTTLHMLYTGLSGSTISACYATADTTSSYTTFTRRGLVMPPSGVPHAYDESQIVPSAMFIDQDGATELHVFFTGTDAGKQRFIDAEGNVGVVDQRTRIGRATSTLPITSGGLPSGTATGQLGTPDGPPIDVRRITRVKTGATVEMSMSVLQPYSNPADSSEQWWSEWFPVIASGDDLAFEDLAFGFGVRAVRWRARLVDPSGTPKLDSVTLESSDLQFEPSGAATTIEIAPPENVDMVSWDDLILRSQVYTFPGATASEVSGTVTVLGTGDATVVPPTPLTLSAGIDQTVSLSAVSPSAHPALTVEFDLSAQGATPQSTPLVEQLQVTYDDGLRTFHGQAPTRLLDTRSGVGRGGVTAPLWPGQQVTVDVTGFAGLPVSGTSAVMMNVTAVNPSGSGYLSVAPETMPRPGIVNFAANESTSNLVVVPVGTGGNVRVANNGSATTHAVIDVVGWYSDATTESPGAHLVSQAPTRLVDTRSGVGRGGVKAALSPGQQITVDVTDVAGLPASGSSAVVLSVTAVNPSAAGYLSVAPEVSPRPGIVNFAAAESTSNLVVVPVGSGGSVRIANNGSATAHVVADAVGWYTEPGSLEGASFRSQAPTRLLDTRNGTGRSGVIGPLTPNQQIVVDVTGPAGLPTAPAAAVLLNVTAVGPNASGYLSLAPEVSPRPGIVNFAAGESMSGLVLVPVGSGGNIRLATNGSATTHVVVDVVGYFR